MSFHIQVVEGELGEKYAPPWIIWNTEVQTADFWKRNGHVWTSFFTGHVHPWKLTWNTKIGVDRRWFSSLLVPPQVFFDGRHTPPWICRQCAYQPDQKLTRLGQRQDLCNFFGTQRVLHKEFGTAEALRLSRLCPFRKGFPLYSYYKDGNWNDQPYSREKDNGHENWSQSPQVLLSVWSYGSQEIGWFSNAQNDQGCLISGGFLKDFVGILCTLVLVVAAFPYFD